MVEMERRKIEREIDVLRKEWRIKEGLMKEKIKDREDKKGLIGKNDELKGRDNEVLGMVKEDERIEKRNMKELEIEDRMIMKMKMEGREWMEKIRSNEMEILGRKEKWIMIEEEG